MNLSRNVATLSEAVSEDWFASMPNKVLHDQLSDADASDEQKWYYTFTGISPAPVSNLNKSSADSVSNSDWDFPN